MMKFLIVVSTILFSLSASAQNLTVVAVGEAGVEASRVAFDAEYGSLSGSELELAKGFVDILRKDFAFYKGTFEVLEGAKTPRVGTSPDFSELSKKGITFAGHVSFRKDALVYASVQLHDVLAKKVVLIKESVLANDKLREAAHESADALFTAVTGKASVFQSQITFICDKGTRGDNIIKELYIMDFDGKNARRLTNHGGVIMSPAISKNRKKILYSLIQKTRSRSRNNNLYVLDVDSGQSELVSSRDGINSGAVFMPGDQSIALTLSHTGNAEIYEVSLATKQIVGTLTKHSAPDVDPSINVDGSKMTFLSGRANKAEIYTMDLPGREKNTKRISYVGKFNATPRFSPDGKEIAFSSWLDNRFDIFRIGSDGHNLVRLTKDFGSNEDPTYSNDGQFIAFASQRVLSRTKAVQNIYIMTRDGEMIGQITDGLGNCQSPRWTK
tara:strand:- start:4599 stop:5924 length:1326 start_codon:yes stop_codon:yes gene_type:complete